MSINHKIEFLEQLRQEFRSKISSNKYRPEMKTEPKNNNLDCIIDPTFRNISNLFVLLFKNSKNDPTRDSFDKYYISVAEIKDFNTLINNK